MPNLIEKFNLSQSKQNIPEIRSGDTVRVHQKITGEKGQDKIQIFEGLVLARKHGFGLNSAITVRKVLKGVGIEKIIPIHSPVIVKIEIVKRGKVRRAKLYYLRTAKGRKARLKRKEFSDIISKEEPEIAETITENTEDSQKIPEAQAPNNTQETENNPTQEESQTGEIKKEE